VAVAGEGGNCCVPRLVPGLWGVGVVQVRRVVRGGCHPSITWVSPRCHAGVTQVSPVGTGQREIEEDHSPSPWDPPPISHPSHLAHHLLYAFPSPTLLPYCPRLQIAAGEVHCAALSVSGAVYTWGLGEAPTFSTTHSAPLDLLCPVISSHPTLSRAPPPLPPAPPLFSCCR
jgi:hypothetical protein